MTSGPARAGSRDERGQTALLIVGFFAVALLLVVVVVDASAAYLRRQELDALADGAALAAADGLQGESVYTEGLGERAEIDPVAARAYVADYVRLMGVHGRYPGFTYRVSTTPETVEVRVSTRMRLPLQPPGWSERTTVTGTASALVRVTG